MVSVRFGVNAVDRADLEAIRAVEALVHKNLELKLIFDHRLKAAYPLT